MKEQEEEMVYLDEKIEKINTEKSSLKDEVDALSKLLSERNDSLTMIEKEVSKVKSNFTRKEEKRVKEYEYTIQTKQRLIEDLNAKLLVEFPSEDFFVTSL